MSRLTKYWKALGPTVGVVLAAANAAGPGNKAAYVVASVIALLTTIFGPANASVPPTPTHP